jgi:hypothetical protein
MPLKRHLLIALFCCGMVVPAAGAAPSVRLTIRNGSVWLAADRATASEILAEWARVGQTWIINAERVPGGPMTLELNGVPEQQALEVVLRSASGFLALARTIARADAMTSRFERIMVLPASTAPPGPIAAPAAGPAAAPVNVPQLAPRVPPGAIAGAAAPQRIIGADGQPLPDDQEDAPPRPPAGAMPPGFVPTPVQGVPGAPGANPATPGANLAAPGAIPVSPAGVPTPGMIVPTPQQPPAAPVPPRRRPGDPR